MPQFLNDYLLPKNDFINYSKIHNRYNKTGFNETVLYFNDSYIFVELKIDSIYANKKDPKVKWKKSIRKIEILKFDSFFE